MGRPNVTATPSMLDIAVHLKDNRHIEYLWQAQVARHWHLPVTTSGPWDPRLVLYLLALRRYTVKSQSGLSPSEP